MAPCYPEPSKLPHQLREGQMNWLTRLSLRIGLASLVVILRTVVAHAVAPPLPVCSWPFEVTGNGITNVVTPDTNATYWIMPLDTNRWRTMVINGTYPLARFFNFSTYTATGSSIATIFDADIVPDSGSTNPFASPAANEPHNYTVTIGAGTGGSANS